MCLAGKVKGAKRDHADLGAIFIGDNGKLEIRRGSNALLSRPRRKGFDLPKIT